VAVHTAREFVGVSRGENFPGASRQREFRLEGAKPSPPGRVSPATLNARAYARVCARVATRACVRARAPRGECINLLRAFVTHLDCRSHADGRSSDRSTRRRSRFAFARGGGGPGVSIGEATGVDRGMMTWRRWRSPRTGLGRVSDVSFSRLRLGSSHREIARRTGGPRGDAPLLAGGAFPPLPRDEACVRCTRDLCTGSTRIAHKCRHARRTRRSRGGGEAGRDGWGKARVARGERESVGATFFFLLPFFLPFLPPPWTRVTGWRPLLYRTFARVVPRQGGRKEGARRGSKEEK